MVWTAVARRVGRFAWRNRRYIKAGYRAYRRIARRRSRTTRTIGRGSSRVFVPRYVRRPIRNRALRRVARQVNRLRNVIDVDTTFKDSNYETHEFVNQNATPVTGGPALPVTLQYNVDLNEELVQNLQAGNRYRLKSLNERFTLSMSTVNSGATNKGTRHVRVMYFLFKDEELPTNSGYPDFDGIFDVPSAGFSLKPALKQNQGYTYRILYDRTFSVNSLSTREFIVRLPARLFYNGGQVKFSPATGKQMNNFLYRVIFVDSLPPPQGTDLGTIHMVSYRRWKYYDFGGATSAAINERLTALENADKALEAQISSHATILQQHSDRITQLMYPLKTNTSGRFTRNDRKFNGSIAQGYTSKGASNWGGTPNEIWSNYNSWMTNNPEGYITDQTPLYVILAVLANNANMSYYGSLDGNQSYPRWPYVAITGSTITSWPVLGSASAAQADGADP